MAVLPQKHRRNKISKIEFNLEEKITGRQLIGLKWLFTDCDINSGNTKRTARRDY